jgi:hypothetical protein
MQNHYYWKLKIIVQDYWKTFSYFSGCNTCYKTIGFWVLSVNVNRNKVNRVENVYVLFYIWQTIFWISSNFFFRVILFVTFSPLFYLELFFLFLGLFCLQLQKQNAQIWILNSIERTWFIHNQSFSVVCLSLNI